jgi:ATP/maltotriose-dependent transcriptional regulator MalT
MRGSDAPALLLRAARTLEQLDLRLARDTYLDTWSAAMLAGRLNDAGGLLDVARAVRTAPEMANPRPSDLLLDGFALACTDGRIPATPVLNRAITAFAGPEVSTEEVIRWSWLATAAAVWLWDYDAGLEIAARGVQLARDLGALELLAVAINVLVQAVVFSGDFAQAARLIAEANAITEATGTRVAPYGALALAALAGREAEAGRLISAAVEDATAGGQGSAVHYASWAQAVLCNGLGRYEEALAAAIKASEMTPVFAVAARTSGELIEAAVRTGNAELAARVLTRLREQTDATEADWALGIAARSRALVSDGAVAEDLYREAIDRFGRTRLRLELARAHLVYGEWLRRQSRRVDARAQLRLAHDMLSEMGADAFAERARRELLATGETVRRRVPETLDELTPQETEIARLASTGLTNPEIGAQLFLSPRTIEWHLRKVYGKLGISSRKALSGALAIVAR